MAATTAPSASSASMILALVSRLTGQPPSWSIARNRCSVATRSGDITRVSQLLYLEPVVSVAGAAVFLGERVTLIMIGGGLLILAGVAVSGTGRDPGTGQESPP